MKLRGWTVETGQCVCGASVDRKRYDDERTARRATYHEVMKARGRRGMSHVDHRLPNCRTRVGDETHIVESGMHIVCRPLYGYEA